MVLGMSRLIIKTSTADVSFFKYIYIYIYIYMVPPPKKKPTFSHFVPIFTVVFAFLKTFFF